jgi:putative ABC transport system substrate-binding protein
VTPTDRKEKGGSDMRRRDFVAFLGGVAVAPLAASAQTEVPVVGYLTARSPEDAGHLAEAFRRGLAEVGRVEGRNVAIEYRWALGHYDRLPAMAAELVRRPVTVLAATGGEPAALAAKAATSRIPTVFAIGGDPVRLGLAASYNRPGGNATGISILTNSLEPKRIGVLSEMLPRTATIGVLVNPNFPPAEGQLRDVHEAARPTGLQVHALRANTDAELDAAFETIGRERIAAVSVAASPFFDTRRDRLIALAARYAVPAMFHFREFVAAGGLMSYGISFPESYRQIGVYAGRILNGEKPGDLPILQPTRFEFVINLKTAKALNLEIPAMLLARADAVIE